MAPDKKQKPGKGKQRAGGQAASSTRSLWKSSLLVAVLALCLYRAIECHKYWNSLSPVVQVRQGPVQGRAALTASGKEYLTFQGIPYAAPPVGALRFRDPEPPASWEPTTLDARDSGNVCMQPPLKFPAEMPSNISAMDVVRFLGVVPALARRAVKLFRMSEDCLYLNVYTPRVDGEPLPVMVYFHGGAFLFGDSGEDMLGPQPLVEAGVVLVTANYRLGPMGFVALGRAAPGAAAVSDAPEGIGNAGLKDAVAVLRWVRDNIAGFGGDPASVTVAGQSAGGALAHYMTLAPSAGGLFQRAAALSGTALHHWAYSPPGRALERTRTLVRRLQRPEAAGGPNGPAAPDMDSPQDMLRYLREVDARLLVDMDSVSDRGEEIKWLMDEFPFQPTADGVLVPAPPLDLIRAGRVHHVPLMVGLTAREGLFAFPSSVAMNRSFEYQAETVDSDFHYALPEYMREALPRGSPALRKAEKAVKQFYFGRGDASIAESSRQQFIDMYGALMFDLDVYRLVRELPAVSSAPIFAYNFTFEGRDNLFRRTYLYHKPDYRGATHCDELGYLFQVEILPKISFTKDDPESKLREQLTTFISNFVKTGDPTPYISAETPIKWPKVTKNETPVLNINVPYSILDGYRPAHMRLWHGIYQNIV